MPDLEIRTKLAKVQSKLKVPKDQQNSFGGYKYRSCEDILEAVKPLLAKHKLLLSITDQLENIGDRYYVLAVAELSDLEADGRYEVHGFAREEESKKGMDGSQITGAASSYARKYALNGMFLIDDTKDSDATNDHSEKVLQVAEPAKITPGLIRPTTMKQLVEAAKKFGYEGQRGRELSQFLINKDRPENEDEAQLVLTTMVEQAQEDAS